MRVGFLGLGRMGEPMALNLVRAGVPLLVWNRSEPALVRLSEAGAVAAPTARQVLRTCETVILMLANDRDARNIRKAGRYGAYVADLVSHPDIAMRILSDAFRKMMRRVSPRRTAPRRPDEATAIESAP